MRTLPRCLLVIILIISSCGCQQPVSETEFNAEISVYQAVIEGLFLNRVQPGLLAIRTPTSTRPMTEDDLGQMVGYIKEQLGEVIDPATLNDFKAKNKQPQPLDGQLRLGVPVAYISDAEMTAIFQPGNGWEQFYEIYPDSTGVITLSRVGFNRDMSQAIVCIGLSGGSMAGVGYYIFLTWDGSAWQIQERLMAWIV